MVSKIRQEQPMESATVQSGSKIKSNGNITPATCKLLVWAASRGGPHSNSIRQSSCWPSNSIYLLSSKLQSIEFSTHFSVSSLTCWPSNSIEFWNIKLRFYGTVLLDLTRARFDSNTCFSTSETPSSPAPASAKNFITNLVLAPVPFALNQSN